MSNEPKPISHRVEDDGGATFFFRDQRGIVTAAKRLTEREAIIFCWSVLADIDPDQLEATYAVPEEEGQRLQGAILGVLCRGPAGAEAIGAQVQLSAAEAGGRLMKLRAQGLVAKIAGKGRGGSIFAITAAGIKAWKEPSSGPAPGKGRKAA
jgi:hypothetical protein